MKFINKKIASILAVSILALNLSLPVVRVKAQEFYAEQVAVDFKESLNCLADNIYWEAATESFEGKLAVAQVTMNRVHSGKFRGSVCEVVKQKDRINGYTICQFSWVCEKISRVIRQPKMYEESVEAARIALTEPYAHSTIYRQNRSEEHTSELQSH